MFCIVMHTDICPYIEHLASSVLYWRASGLAMNLNGIKRNMPIKLKMGSRIWLSIGWSYFA